MNSRCPERKEKGRFKFQVLRASRPPCVCSVTYASMASTGTITYPRSYSNDTIPFDLPKLQRTILTSCFTSQWSLVYVRMLSTCDCRTVSRLHLMMSVSPCNRHRLSRNMSSPTHSFSTAEDPHCWLWCAGSDIRYHSLFTLNVMSARSWQGNKDLASCDMYLLVSFGPLALVPRLPRHILLECALSCHVLQIQDLHEHVHMYVIMLTHHASLSNAILCLTLSCFLVAYDWWFVLWQDTPLLSCSWKLQADLPGPWPLNRHHVSLLKLGFLMSEQILRADLLKCSCQSRSQLLACCVTCCTWSLSTIQLFQRRRPLCPPLTDVPPQVSEPLLESTHVTRRCAWLRMLVIRWRWTSLHSTLAAEESPYTDLVDLHCWVFWSRVVDWFAWAPLRMLCLCLSTSWRLGRSDTFRFLHVRQLSHGLRSRAHFAIIVFALGELQTTAIIFLWCHQCTGHVDSLPQPSPAVRGSHDGALRTFEDQFAQLFFTISHLLMDICIIWFTKISNLTPSTTLLLICLGVPTFPT